MKEACDKNKVCTAVFTGFFKEFDSLKHDLVIAKLHFFDFDPKPIRVMPAYLNDMVIYHKS